MSSGASHVAPVGSPAASRCRGGNSSWTTGCYGTWAAGWVPCWRTGKMIKADWGAGSSFWQTRLAFCKDLQKVEIAHKLSAFSASISQVAAIRNQARLTLLSKWLRPGPESLHKALCCPAKASKRFGIHLKSNPKRLHHQTCWDDMACNGHHSRHTHLPSLSRLSWHIMATHIGR